MVAAASIEEALGSALADDWMAEGGYGMGGERDANPATFLSAVALIIAKEGWLSRKAARECFGKRSTADAAWDVLFPPKKYEGPRFEEITDDHRADAAASLAWAKEIPKEPDSDFLFNCRLAAHQGAWGGKLIGIGAAILMSWQKEQQRLKRMEFERKMPSEYIGKVGERFGAPAKSKKDPGTPCVRARVLGIHPYQSDFGLTNIVRMQAPGPDGTTVHDMVWFAKGSIQVVTDPEAIEASVVADKIREKTYQVFESAKTAARAAWYAAGREGNPHYFFDNDTEWGATDEGRPFVSALNAARSAWLDADKAASAAGKLVTAAYRDIKPGDLVDVAASVKDQKISDRTNRKETTLLRCTLKLVKEEEQ